MVENNGPRLADRDLQTGICNADTHHYNASQASSSPFLNVPTASDCTLINRLSEFLAPKLPFFYGHVIVLIAILAQIASSPGQTFAISAFTPILQEQLHLSSSQLAAAYMLGTLLAAFPLAIIGPFADRCGLRTAATVVVIALSLACCVMSRATGFYSLLCGFLLLRFLGQGALTLLSSNIVSMWFHQRLGTINAIMSAGSAVAFAVVPLLLIDSIQSLGWRATYVTMGMILAVTLLPVFVLLLRNRPEDLGQSPDGLQAMAKSKDHVSMGRRDLSLSEAIGHRTFWILALDLALWAMIGTGIVFYALPIFLERGIAESDSKLLFTTFSISMLTAQIVSGILADRLPMHRLLACGFALLSAGVLAIPLTTQILHVHLFALLFGAGQGTAISVNSTMWVRYYGRTHLGKIRGVVWCSTVAGSGCGPLVLGLFADNTGSFTPGLWVFFVALLPLAPISLWATAPPKNTEPPDGSANPSLPKHFRHSADVHSADEDSLVASG